MHLGNPNTWPVLRIKLIADSRMAEDAAVAAPQQHRLPLQGERAAGVGAHLCAARLPGWPPGDARPSCMRTCILSLKDISWRGRALGHLTVLAPCSTFLNGTG